MLRRLGLALRVTLALLAGACGVDGTAGVSAADTSTSSALTPTTTVPTTTVPTTTTLAPIPTPEVSDVESLLALERPVVAGHAGGDRTWPHSTMYGFAEAARAGVDVLDMDVQLTGDGVLVVQHDDTVDKTTETTGRVRDLTYDELQALDNGYWWSANWPSHDGPEDAYVHRGVRTGALEPPAGYGPDDFRVETFRAVAEAFPDHVLNIEIKRPRGDDGEEDIAFATEGAVVLAEEVAALDRDDSVIVVADNEEVMATFRGLAPDVVTAPSTTEVFSWLVGSAELASSVRLLQIPPTVDGADILTDDILGRAAADDLLVWVWPNADELENADYYEELVTVIGGAGVIAARPAEAVGRFATLG